MLPWAVAVGLSLLLLSSWYRGLTRFSGSYSLYGLLTRAGLAVLLLVNNLLGTPQPPRSFWLLYLSAVLNSSRSRAALLCVIFCAAARQPFDNGKPELNTLVTLRNGLPTRRMHQTPLSS